MYKVGDILYKNKLKRYILKEPDETGGRYLLSCTLVKPQYETAHQQGKCSHKYSDSQPYYLSGTWWTEKQIQYNGYKSVERSNE